MFIHRYLTQPANGVEYSSLLSLALSNGHFTSLDVAVAYATLQGVKALESSFDNDLEGRWLAARKRWLVGIDWCRTEPLALERLSDLEHSVCRIHDGRRVVRRGGCFPWLPYHPKMFVFRGRQEIAVIAGSGNLSRNGLTKGHEIGSLLLVKNPASKVENELWNSCQGIVTWFQREWRVGTPLDEVQQAYGDQHAKNLKKPTPTDDDAAESDLLSLNRPRRALSPEKLARLRASQHLWIEAGNLHKNRGPGLPGNQLMLSPMTRVFFGFMADDVPPDTAIGHIAIRYRHHLREDCSLRFSNNSMDVLTLPLPGQQGPEQYDQETLMFEKMPDKSFSLAVGNRAEIRRWQRFSTAIDALYSMTSGRQWGVF